MLLSYKHLLIAYVVLLHGGQAFAQVSGVQADEGIGGTNSADASVASPPPVIDPQALNDDSDATNPRIGPVLQLDTSGQLLPLANTRAQPQQGGGAPLQGDPYAPLGLRAGSFLLFPTITHSFGHTSNADAVSGGDSAAFSKSEVDLRLRSDWSRHQMQGRLYGDYQRFFDDNTASLVNMGGELDLRIDHTRNVTTNHGISISAKGQGASSDTVEVPANADVSENPVSNTYTAFSGATVQTGRLTSTIRGTLSRTEVSSAVLSNGTRLNQDDQDNTVIGGTLRLSYKTSPAIKPFVELGVSSVRYDELVPGTAFNADANTYSLRAGIDFNLREKLNGSFDIGYSTQDFENSALDDLSALTLNGSLNWSPERFTTITAELATTLNGSAGGVGRGAITHVGTLSFARDVSAQLTLGGRVSLSMQDFQKSARLDKTWQAEANAEYRVNRKAALFGRLGYETTSSSDAQASFDATTAIMGLRIQH